MNGITTVTQKGQVTIPAWLRSKYDLEAYSRVQVQAGDGYIKISPVEDILKMAGSIKPIKNRPIMKAREYMEKHYKRF